MSGLWAAPTAQEYDASNPQISVEPVRLFGGWETTCLLETSFCARPDSERTAGGGGAIPTSQAQGLVLYEWEILFSRLPAGAPAFRQAPILPPDQVWPDTDPLTPASVWQRAKFLLLMMLHTPAVFHNQELHSVQITLDLARSDLLKLMWRRAGLSYGKRAKHMSQIFPASWLTSLNDTYPTDPTVMSTLAAPLLRIYALQAVHFKELAAAAGGGFPLPWFERQFAWLTRELGSILGQDCGEFSAVQSRISVG